MGNEIKEYLNVLQIGQDDEAISLQACRFILSKDIRYLSDNRVEVAALFYQILCSFQRIYDEEPHLKAGKIVVNLFTHIALINADIGTQSEDSNLMTIWFLNQLKQGADVNQTSMKSCIGTLMSGLEDIHFVFEIENEGVRVFPIDKLISNVIMDATFLNVSSITPYHIQMLQLAVQLFVEQADKQLLQQLITECKLEFLNFMDGSHRIIDTNDFLNYQKNGVMIFYNMNKNAVLIRNEREGYFTIKGTTPLKVEKEVNHQGKVIGNFVVIENVGDATLIDFSDVLKENPTEILKMIYTNGYYNIFHEKSLIKKDEKILPLNPYVLNDQFIIKGYTDSVGKSFSKDMVQKCIRKHRMTKIQGKSLDIVTLGLVQDLLEFMNVDVDELLALSDDSDWKQNLLIEKWVSLSADKKKALDYVLGKYCDELGYCISKTEFENHDIKPQDILPYNANIDWAYEILGLDVPQYSTYFGEIDLNEDGKEILIVNNRKTVAGKRNPINSELGLELLEGYNDLSKDDQMEYKRIGSEHYWIYDRKNDRWIGCIDDEVIYRKLAQVELLLESNSILLEFKDEINENQVNIIAQYMELHKDALMGVDSEHQLFADFKSMVIYRLIHCIIWNKLTVQTWPCFFRIVNQHQKLTFNDMRSDAIFRRKDPNCLYVPKDAVNSDSTLLKAYNKYISECSTRDHNNPFGVQMTRNSEGKYLLNGNIIKRIIFLFDNTCSGKSTCSTIAMYLEKTELLDSKQDEEFQREAFRRLQVYHVADSVVSISEIMEANQIDEVNVHSFYGTDYGKIKIEDLLKKAGIKSYKVDFTNEITHHYDLVDTDIDIVWPHSKDRYWNVKNCLFIREFNQPKRNVFPEVMINDAKKSICLFVVKKEFHYKG